MTDNIDAAIARVDCEIDSPYAAAAGEPGDQDRFQSLVRTADLRAIIAHIDALRDDAARMRVALTPFAAIICRVDEADEAKGHAFDTYPDNQHVFAVGKDRVITAGDLRRARAELAEGGVK